MPKIKCYILRKNRTIKMMKVDPSNREFDWNHALYVIPDNEINLLLQKGKINTSTELFYIEGIPQSIISEKFGVINRQFLEDKIFENFIDQMAKVDTRWFPKLVQVLKTTVFSPGGIIMAIILFALLYELIRGGKIL